MFPFGLFDTLFDSEKYLKNIKNIENIHSQLIEFQRQTIQRQTTLQQSGNHLHHFCVFINRTSMLNAFESHSTS